MALELLAEALRFPTVTYSNYDKIDLKIHRDFLSFFQDTFPNLHNRTQVTEFDEFGRIYHITGKNPALSPILLLSHYDVVPVQRDLWSVDPFAGIIENDVLYGRGAMDDKHRIMAWAETVEQLLVEGWQPERSIYLAFGGDEEVQGFKGAGVMSAWFRKKGIRFEWILDEGSFIADGFLPGARYPLALIGIAEKGFLNMKITAGGSGGGHAAMPPDRTAPGILANAVAVLETSKPKPKIIPMVRAFITRLAPHMTGIQAIVLANLWLTAPLVARKFSNGAETAAMLRTTYAPTMLKGSDKENVLPKNATAIVNCRILPGESIEGTLQRARRIINDPDVSVENLNALESSEPVAPSSMDGSGYQALVRTLESCNPGIPALPYLFVATTDSRHYADLSEQVLRFSPVQTIPEEMRCVHGPDEHISRNQYDHMILFYTELIQSA
jgi:carboxypeptidase PM20D1